jgi:fused signal recognition particle receptor
MFDGLKEKLGRFREDVEEEAVEEVEDPEDAEPAEADAEGAGTAETDAEGASAADADIESPTEPDEPRTDVEEVDDGTDDEGAGEKKGQDLAQRAKLFATGRAIIEEGELEEPLEELELSLLQGDVEMTVAREITERLREELVGQTRAQVQTGEIMVERAIGDALRDVIGVGQFDFEERIAEAETPVTIIFTGVNGVGKTTTIAKLGRYLEERGYDVVLANGDTYRAGANEQLQKHADNLDLKLISHEQGGDPAAVIYDAVEYAEANDVDIVLGDTAGRLHTSNDLMSQLEKIDRVVGPDLTLFADEAVAGQDATKRAEQFDDAAEIDGVVLTKADADSQGGAAISIAEVTGKPILFLGTGQGYDDIEQFDPEVIVDRLTE